MLKYCGFTVLFLIQYSLSSQEMARLYAVTDCLDGNSTLFFEVDSILVEVYTSPFIVKYTPKGSYDFTINRSYSYSGKMENISPGNYDVYMGLYSSGVDLFGIEIEEDSCKNPDDKNQVISYGYWKSVHFLKYN